MAQRLIDVPIESLPFVDALSVDVAAGPDAVWDALIVVTGEFTSRPGGSRAAHALGCAHTERLARRTAGLAELGRDHHLVAAPGDRPAEEPFVGSRPVHVRRVEHGHPEVEGAPDRLHRFALVGVAVELRHAHAAEPELRHLEIAEPPRPHP